MNKRLDGLDILRGFAIALMIIFHISYDLNYFDYIDINITQDSFWINFRIVIVTLFLFAVGVSLALTHKDGIKWSKVKKRVIILGISAILISIVTYIIFPNEWVYFGIIHSILILSIIGLLFINRPYLALTIAILILIGYNFFNFNMHPIFNYLQKPLHLPKYTVDLAPIIPWLNVVLFGIALVAFKLEHKVFNIKLFRYNNPFLNILKIMGRHSLLIYMIHQPIIFGILYAIYQIK